MTGVCNVHVMTMLKNKHVDRLRPRTKTVLNGTRLWRFRLCYAYNSTTNRVLQYVNAMLTECTAKFGDFFAATKTTRVSRSQRRQKKRSDTAAVVANNSVVHVRRAYLPTCWLFEIEIRIGRGFDQRFVRTRYYIAFKCAAYIRSLNYDSNELKKKNWRK